MSRHLIVSCGTSQIEERKLKQVGLNKTNRDWCAKLVEDHASINDETPDALNPQATILVSRLVAAEKWNNLMKREKPKFIGSPNNPFGAEISTLAKMHQDGRFNPDNDTATLLYSDTKAGAFCVAVLRGLLTHDDTWKMPLNRVMLPVRVPMLREEIAESDAERAEENLCNCIVRARSKESENCLVVTGGFKSAIPFFATVALIFGDPMYSLFERSEALRCLNLPREVRDALDSPEPGSRWKRAVEAWKSEGASVAAGLRRILEERAKRDDEAFGKQAI